MFVISLQALGMVLLTLLAFAQVSLGQQSNAPKSAAASFADPLFSQSYVDVDEWRQQSVHHRYVHGGFKGTDARFSINVPARAQSQGRFFQHIIPVPLSENLAQIDPGSKNVIGMAISSGAYFIPCLSG
jgi:hypothetical protein